MFDIESIRVMFDGNAVEYTQHFKARIKERKIKHADVKQALLTGEIIEQHLSDEPLPSILVLGYIGVAQPLHIVVSIDDDKIWLVTAYIPSKEVWERDNKTRKVVKKL